MITLDPGLAIGTTRTTAFASLPLNTGVADGRLAVTSKVPGLFGNRVSVEVRIDGSPGPPLFSLNGLEATLRMPSYLSFEASGSFAHSALNASMFIFLWYSGTFNGRESFAKDGLPVTWPLTRNGEFVLYNGGAWHMIRRAAGAEQMHWQSDSSHLTVDRVPSGTFSVGNPEGWYGVAAGCTGWISAHYGVDHTQAQYFSYFLDGDATLSVPPNPELIAKLGIALAPGQSGTGRVASSARQRLSGGS